MKSNRNKKVKISSVLNTPKSAGQRMKNTFIQTKAKVDQQDKEQDKEQEKQNNTSPTAYAENALTDTARAGADKAGRTLNRQGKKAVRNLPKTLRSGKQAIKTAQKSIKTAKQGQAAAIKTAKAAKQSAQAAAKTAQKAAKASRASVKATAKAVVAAVKAAISAVKGIVVLIAAGGWIAVVIIVLICAFGMILAFLAGGNGDVSALPSDFSFTSSALEQFLGFQWPK